MFKKKTAYYNLITLVVIAVVIAGVLILVKYKQNFENKISNFVSEKFLNQSISLDDKLTYLEEQIEFLRKQNLELAEKVEQKPQEIIRREIIREKSQDTLLTEAVARITPAVVSIVASKDVPLLEVEYINPFGDDPFFKDFNFRVPRYKQKGTTEQQVGSGTGFIISANGKIVTNRHVVKDPEARYMVLLQDGTQKQAVVSYRDDKNDIAILDIDGSDYPTADLGGSGELKLGQAVFAVGNALGEYSNSVSVGIISGLNRNINASGTVIENVIQTDAAINPGNSGGPLVSLNGEVVGVNVATVLGSENISFSIPIDMIKDTITLN